MKDKVKDISLNIIFFLFYYFFYKIFDYILKIGNIIITNRTIAIILMYVIDIIPIIFLVFVFRKDFNKDLDNFKNKFLPNIDKYLCYWIIAILLMGISSQIIEFITGNITSNNEEAVRSISKILPIYSLISCTIFAPLGEELRFRKCIRNIFKNKTLCIIMSGLIFGVAHVIGTYKTITDILYIIPYGCFGSIFMYIYLDTDSIFSTMFIHFSHNLMLSIMMLL